jgi:hypothetical protein
VSIFSIIFNKLDQN